MNNNLDIKDRQNIRWTGIPIENLTHQQLLSAFRDVAMSYQSRDREWYAAVKRFEEPGSLAEP